MDMVTCPACNSRVLTSTDNICPSCGKDVTSEPTSEDGRNPYEAPSKDGKVEGQKPLLTVKGIGQVLLVLSLFYLSIAYFGMEQMNASERTGAMAAPFVVAAIGGLLILLGRKK